MINAAAILALMLEMPPCWTERADTERVAHVGTLAQSIANVAQSTDDAAGLFTVLFAESAGCWSVATGVRRGGAGLGPWQIEPGSHRSAPLFGDDLESLTHAAGEALWLWRHSYGCGPWLTARFESYAGLGCVAWSGAGPRTRLYRWAYWRLSKP